MVKPTPKIPAKSTRKRKLFEFLYRNKLRDTTIPTISSPISVQNPTNFINLKSQETIQVTPPTRKKRRSSRSPTNFSFSSSTYGTCSSSSSSSRFSSPSCFLDSKSPPGSSFLGVKSPQPQYYLLQCHCSAQHQQQLRRTISDPPKFLSDIEESSTSKKMGSSPSIARNLMTQLPPLPPSPSPKLLRTFSDPVHLSPAKNCCISKKEKEEENEKVEEKTVKVEKLSMDLVLIRYKCNCGSYIRLLFSNSDSKCYKLS